MAADREDVNEKMDVDVEDENTPKDSTRTPDEMNIESTEGKDVPLEA